MCHLSIWKSFFVDIDECSEGLAACGDGDLCQNQAGAYVCVKQPAIKEKPCSKEGYIRNSDGKCVGMCSFH